MDAINTPQTALFGGSVPYSGGSDKLIEGLIFGTLLGNRNGGGLFGGNNGGSADLDASGIAAKVVELQNSANILAELGRSKDCFVGEFRGVNAGLFAVNDAVKDGNYAAAIQAERNTAQLSTQATAFAFAQERQADQNTLAILNKLNQSELDRKDEIISELRFAGIEERRRHDDEKIQIVNTNSNTNVLTAIQQQAQWQAQRDEENKRNFAALWGSFNQINRTAQDIVNLGTMTSSGTQATNATNIK